MSADKARRRNIHPFPARMAPDIALTKIKELTKAGAVVLDPMCGSGTVPSVAAATGRRAVACDLDPLAVVITRTACKPDWSLDLEARAKSLVAAASRLGDSAPKWISSDEETTSFIEYWFAPKQRIQLGRIARALASRPTVDDPLRVALSRLIVTKDGGASLARDTSHSRPHRVRLNSDFDVFAEFIKSAKKLEKLADADVSAHKPSIRSVDARTLGFIETGSVDLVLTSPPYLNAIDYLRGHRLSLVWLGWQLHELRELRGESIGSERALRDCDDATKKMAIVGVPRLDELPVRDQRIVWRFTRDVERLCRSLSRVTRSGGHLVFVVADSRLKSVPVQNSHLCRIAAERHGFEFQGHVLRSIPAQHRYLPPPESDASTFGARMRHEQVLTFKRVG